MSKYHLPRESDYGSAKTGDKELIRGGEAVTLSAEEVDSLDFLGEGVLVKGEQPKQESVTIPGPDDTNPNEKE